MSRSTLEVNVLIDAWKHLNGEWLVNVRRTNGLFEGLKVQSLGWYEIVWLAVPEGRGSNYLGSRLKATSEIVWVAGWNVSSRGCFEED